MQKCLCVFLRAVVYQWLTLGSALITHARHPHTHAHSLTDKKLFSNSWIRIFVSAKMRITNKTTVMFIIIIRAETFSWLLISNYCDIQAVVLVIFKQKTKTFASLHFSFSPVRICFFFFVIYGSKLKIFGFWIIGQTKEDVTLDSEKLW